MSIAKLSRSRKQQLGQFLTPPDVAAAIVRRLDVRPAHRVLEPSFGEGAFLLPLIDTIHRQLHAGAASEWCRTKLFGCELDGQAYEVCSRRLAGVGLSPVPAGLERGDFFRWMPSGFDRTAATDPSRYRPAELPTFDIIVGNPPFGGSIDPDIQDDLDAIFGVRGGRKVKKETYAFFLVKCVDLLKPGGRLAFVCSDTLLTIATMAGLRRWLRATCDVSVADVPGSFTETTQGMVLVELTRRDGAYGSVQVFGRAVRDEDIDATPNGSWRADGEVTRLFAGGLLGDKFVATSGMTIGNNDLFLRRVTGGAVVEPFEFSLAEQPITVENMVARARLGRVPPARMRRVQEQVRRGETETVVAYRQLPAPTTVPLPHSDYCFYNKASPSVLYAPPEWVVFWRDAGEYVYRYKKTGNWYLHGVGGKNFFGREGVTWALVAQRFHMRYLPPGYILDSGAPCAFLRPGIEADELPFVLGWCLTTLCNRILKDVINHTRNIQGKDFERLPYPFWVPADDRRRAVELVRGLIKQAERGARFTFDSPAVRQLDPLYRWREATPTASGCRAAARQPALF